jgi:hypothetical protein
MISVCSVVTEKTLKEFQLLKFSLEQHYEDIKWYVSCDGPTSIALFDEESVSPHILIESDDCDHNVADQKKRDAWMNVMMTKFDICRIALKENDSTLFLDCDMLFTNFFDEKTINLANNQDVDAMLCQHMTNNWANEAKHGLYNAGMFFVRNEKFLDEWESLSKNYKKLNLYFEQGPLTYVQRYFHTVNLPMSCNMGWWRFNERDTRPRLNHLKLNEEGEICLGPHKVVNFHMHTLRELETTNFGQFLVDKVFDLMRKSKNKKYDKIVDFYEGLNNA